MRNGLETRCLVVDAKVGMFTVIAAVDVEVLESGSVWVDLVAPQVVTNGEAGQIVFSPFGMHTDGLARVNANSILSHSTPTLELNEVHMELVSKALGGLYSSGGVS